MRGGGPASRREAWFRRSPPLVERGLTFPAPGDATTTRPAPSARASRAGRRRPDRCGGLPVIAVAICDSERCRRPRPLEATVGRDRHLVGLAAKGANQPCPGLEARGSRRQRRRRAVAQAAADLQQRLAHGGRHVPCSADLGVVGHRLEQEGAAGLVGAPARGTPRPQADASSSRSRDSRRANSAATPVAAPPTCVTADIGLTPPARWHQMPCGSQRRSGTPWCHRCRAS